MCERTRKRTFAKNCHLAVILTDNFNPWTGVVPDVVRNEMEINTHASLQRFCKVAYVSKLLVPIGKHDEDEQVNVVKKTRKLETTITVKGRCVIDKN